MAQSSVHFVVGGKSPLAQSESPYALPTLAACMDGLRVERNSYHQILVVATFDIEAKRNTEIAYYLVSINILRDKKRNGSSGTFPKCASIVAAVDSIRCFRLSRDCRNVVFCS